MKLTAILQESGHKETAFTSREWSQIQELVRVLEPFAEATDLTQAPTIFLSILARPASTDVIRAWPYMMHVKLHLPLQLICDQPVCTKLPESILELRMLL
ncbi:hypothetical protein N1851_011134 [Merluccius polli]|uniref:Uncharacterized protein n=1 Tax=Merluccius polli TaxID=89951 RepID=A0AA47MXP1_MERPO|nr:hypothetical protein N1851_011134 [Merluccius polli]